MVIDVICNDLFNYSKSCFVNSAFYTAFLKSSKFI